MWNLIKSRAHEWLVMALALVIFPAMYSGFNMEELRSSFRFALAFTLGYIVLVLVIEVGFPALGKSLCRYEFLRKHLNNYGVGRTDLGRRM